MGEARRIDEAFQILESLEQGSARGNAKLSAPLIIGLLNAIIEAGYRTMEKILLSFFILAFLTLTLLLLLPCLTAVVQEIYAVLMVFLHVMGFCFVKEAILRS